MKAHEIDMTEGSLAKKIWIFSIPLMCSNMLQVLFNLADVAVVGKFAGPIALGSVGSTSLVIALTTGILIGLSGGVNSVTALFAGSKDSVRIQKCVHTAFLICLAAGILLLFSGIFLSMPLLRLIGTKEELISGARLYLTIYLLGSPGLAMYNYGNAVLSSIGDTKRPLTYLMIAGVLNVILNLVFVLGFHMDVAGVALASIISQYTSAILVLRFLLTCGAEYGLYPKQIRFDAPIAGRILAIGIPTAIQYSLFSVANLFIQSAVNSFDHVVVEGNSAAANADNLIYEVMGAFYTACTSFIAQNLGAGKMDRVKKTYGITLVYTLAISLFISALYFVFCRQFLLLFTSDEEVISYGTIRLQIMSCSYFISAFMDDSAAAARGMGKSVIPVIIVILGTVVYRIIWVCTVFAHFHTLPSLYLVFATAWIFTSIMGNIYLFLVFRESKKSVKKMAF